MADNTIGGDLPNNPDKLLALLILVFLSDSSSFCEACAFGTSGSAKVIL